MLEKRVAAVFGLILSASVLFSGCSGDPMAIYKKARLKTSVIQTAKQDITVTIDTDNNGTEKKEVIDIKGTANFKEKVSDSTMKITSGDNSVDMKMYTKGNDVYLNVPGSKDDYYKTSCTNDQFSREALNVYSDKIIKIISSKADLRDNILSEKDRKTKAKYIMFDIPADMSKILVQDILKQTINNENVKNAAIKQVMSQMKEEYKGQNISEDQIKEIITKQMEEMVKSIDESFKNLTFTDLKYQVAVDKDGYISDQAFSFGITNKNKEKINIVIEQKLSDINENCNIKLPTIEDKNVTEVSNFMNIYMPSSNQ